VSTAAPIRRLVVCALGAEQYGLPIERVREIVRSSPPRPVASDVPWMRGVVNLRGRLVPVHDLAEKLGLVTSPAGVRSRSSEGETLPPPSAKLVIVEAGGEPVGLLVDDVVEVLGVEAEQVEPVPSGSGEIVRLGERLLLLLGDDELGL
jgi:purine-binding chemotaxis protein CheW